MTEPQTPTNEHLTRIALVVVVFVATLGILVGLASVFGRATDVAPSGSEGASSLPSTSIASPVLPSQFASASGLVGDPVLVGAGDIADCSQDGGAATALLLDGIAGTVYTAGDNVYPTGTTENFATCYDAEWGRHRLRTRPAPGNHDWETGSLDAYLEYFGSAATGPDGSSWYSYDLGAWHIVVLDSSCEQVDGCGPDSDQGRWLTADLAATDAHCTMAIWHHPRFSSGHHGSDATVAPFWRALYDAGADVIVNGHEHDYERFAPQDPDGVEDRDRGVRQFIVGTGGAALRAFELALPNSELRMSVDHGVLAFTLRERGYDWRFVPATTDISRLRDGQLPLTLPRSATLAAQWA